MADLDLKILLRLVDKATKPLKKSFKGISGAFAKVGQSFQKNWALFTVGFLVAQRAMRSLINLTKQFISAADAVEQYQVRMKVLLGTVEEGTQVFSDMKELAGQVPKTYDEIMASATDLAAVVKDGSSEIKKLMPIIVDLSAGTGMSVREVTGQMIRMYSAGAAAADMFRERGVSAALGFMPGQSISAADTMKQIIAQWEDGSSKFAGASEELAKTFTGQVSMMDDAWFNFRAGLGKLITESPEVIGAMNDITESLKNLTIEVDDWVVSGGLDQMIIKIRESALGFQFLAKNVEGAIVAFTFGKGYFERQKEVMTELEEIWNKIAVNQAKFREVETLSPESLERNKAQELSKIKDKLRIDDVKKSQKSAAEITKIEAEKWNKNISQAKGYYSFLSQTVNMAAAQNKSFAVLAQGVAIGEAMMNTALGATKALAQLGAFGIPVAAAITALGMAQVAMITQQKFHDGGMVGGSGDVPLIAQSGEGILSRRGMAALGGAGELNDLNAGGGGGIAINIENANFREDQDVEDVATMLAEVLEEQRRARV